MAKLILLSVILASVAVPLAAARDGQAVRGARRTVLLMSLFNLLYLLGVLFVLPRA